MDNASNSDITNICIGLLANKSSIVPILYKHNALIPAFFQFYNQQFSNSLSTQSSIDFSFLRSLWLASLQTYTAYHGSLDSMGKSSICGKTFQSGEIAYKCNDCGDDPTCVICVECYHNSNHDGHDVLMIHTGGGCCDCGDEEAWDPKGFCKNHKGQQADDDDAATEKSLPTFIHDMLSAIVLTTFRCWFVSVWNSVQTTNLSDSDEDGELDAKRQKVKNYVSLSDQQKTQLSKSFKKCSASKHIVEFLLQLCSDFGDNAKRIIGNCLYNQSLFGSTGNFCNPFGTTTTITSSSGAEVPYCSEKVENSITNPALLSMMIEANGCFGSIQLLVYQLYHQLLSEQQFKWAFAHKFVQKYGSLMENYFQLESSPSRSGDLTQLSVQLFTTPSLTNHLCNDCPLASTNNVLSLLINKLSDTLERSKENIGLEALQRLLGIGNRYVEGQLNFSHPLIKSRRLYHIIFDIKYIIRSNKQTAYNLLFQSNKQLDELLKLLTLLQGTKQMKRVTKSHAGEDPSWAEAFDLDTTLQSVVKCFRNPLLIDADGITLPNPLPMKHEKRIKEFITNFVVRIIEWVTESSPSKGRIVLELPPFTNVGLQVCKGTVSRDIISLHTPLHHFLADLLLTITRNFYLSPTELLEPAAKKLHVRLPTLGVLLIEHILQTRVALAQINAGLWKRNGLNLMAEADVHCKHRAYTEEDLFLLQLCASIMPANQYVYMFIQKFEMEPHLGFNKPGASVQNDDDFKVDTARTLAIFENMVRLLVIIAVSRNLCGSKSVEEQRKEEILHLLFVADLAHSEIMRALPKRLKRDEMAVDKCIRAVATRDSESNKFKVNSSEWTNFNPYFLHYTAIEAQEAEERYHAATKAKTSAEASIPNCPSLQFPLSGFEHIIDLLRSTILHSLIFFTLCSFNFKLKFKSVLLLNQALHLLHLCIQQQTKRTGDTKNTQPVQISSVGTAYDVTFAGNNILENCRQKFTLPCHTENVSIISLLLSIKNESKGHAAFIQDLLISIANYDSENAQLILPHINTEIDNSDEEAKKKALKRKKSLARKQSIKETMMKRGKKFLAQSAEVAAFQKAEQENNQSGAKIIICDLCREASDSLLTNPMGKSAYIQSGGISVIANEQLLKKEGMQNINSDSKEEQNNATKEQDNENAINSLKQTAPAIHFCGHHMHVSCYQTYFATLVKNELERSAFVQSRLDLNNGEFFCPCCRSLANCLVPILPTDDNKEFKEANITTASNWQLCNPKEESTANEPLALIHQNSKFQNALAYITANNVSTSNSNSTFKSSTLTTKAKEFVEFYNHFISVILKNKLNLDLYETPTTNVVDIPLVCDMAFANIEWHEIAQRILSVDNVLPKLPNAKEFQQFKGLFNLSSFSSSACKLPDEVCRIWRLVDYQNNNESNTNILSEDLFKCLFLITSSWPSNTITPTKQEFQQLCFSLLIAQIIQAIYSIMALPTTSTSNSLQLSTSSNSDSNVEIQFIYKTIMQTIADSSNNTTALAAITNEDINERIYSFVFNSCILQQILFDEQAPSSYLSDMLISLFGKLSVQENSINTCAQSLIHNIQPAKVLKIASINTKWSFIPLPHNYNDQEFFKYFQKECMYCNENLRKTALCLICGNVCCIGECPQHKKGTLNKHAKECANGDGIFLYLTLSVIILLKNKQGTYWGSLFIDKFGEEDIGLKRGKPLFKSEKRINDLLKVLFNHQIPSTCIKNPAYRIAWESL